MKKVSSIALALLFAASAFAYEQIGQLNPYAYGVSGTAKNNKIAVAYSLNSPADSTIIAIYRDGEEVGTQVVADNAPGLHSAVVDIAAFGTAGTYTVVISTYRSEYEKARFTISYAKGLDGKYVISEQQQAEEETHDEITQIVVRQKIKGTLFMTEKTMTTTLQNGEKMKEVSNVEVELKEGTRLIWLEGKGYVFPNENFKTMHEIAEDIENLKSLDLGE